MMRMIFPVAAWLAVALTPAWAQSAAAPAAPPEVGVITAAEQPVYDEQSYVGRIQSPQIVQLNARVTGFLEAQDFKNGDTVTQGQLLYVIEQPPYQAAVTQAQAAVEQARAQSRNANLTLGRAQALLSTPAGLPSSVDSSRAAAVSGSAQIDSATAQLQTAQINLGYTEIRSPIDGRISATNVDVGNVVGPTSGPLATVVSQDPVWITFSLPAVEAFELQSKARQGGLAGVELLVKLPDGEIYGQTASIDFVNNQITQSTDTLAMRGTVANPLIPGLNNQDTGQRTLQDGEFINVILRSRQARQSITVPSQAVVADQLGSYVLMVDKTDTVRRQNVTTGQATPDSVVILSGLKIGDRIVVDGIQRVHPGGKVNPQPAKTTPVPGSGQD